MVKEKDIIFPFQIEEVVIKHRSTSSLVLVLLYIKLCSLEYPNVVEKILNSKSSPCLLIIFKSSFQSNCNCSPGEVSYLKWTLEDLEGFKLCLDKYFFKIRICTDRIIFS